MLCYLKFVAYSNIFLQTNIFHYIMKFGSFDVHDVVDHRALQKTVVVTTISHSGQRNCFLVLMLVFSLVLKFIKLSNLKK